MVNNVTEKRVQELIKEAKEHAKGNMLHQTQALREDVRDVQRRIDNLMFLGIAGLIGLLIAVVVFVI